MRWNIFGRKKISRPNGKMTLRAETDALGRIGSNNRQPKKNDGAMIRHITGVASFGEYLFFWAAFLVVALVIIALFDPVNSIWSEGAPLGCDTDMGCE